MKIMFHRYLSEEVSEDIKDCMTSVRFDDSKVNRLYCIYNSDNYTYTNYTINLEELIDEFNINDSDMYIVEVDLQNYYLNELKAIVLRKSLCEVKKLDLFNLVSKILMAYGNEQVLSGNYTMENYFDIFKLIIKLKEMI